MKTQQAVARQFLGLAAGRAGASAISALWFVVAARLLGVEAFGHLSLILALGLILSTATDLGLLLLLADAVARAPERGWSLFVAVLCPRLVASIVAGVVLVVLYVLASDGPLAPAGLFAVSIVATAVYTSANVALRSAGRVGPEAWNEVGSRLVVLVLGGAWLVLGGGVLAAVAAYVIADVLSAGVLAGVARRRLPALSPVGTSVPFAWREVIPLALAGLMVTAYQRIDIWLLAMFHDEVTVALYSASYKLLDAALLPATALTAFVVAAIAGLERSARDRSVRRFVAGSAVATALVATPAALAARPILEVAFGPDYSAAAPLLVVLMAAGVPAAAVLVLGQSVAIRDPRRYARIVAFALAVNVALNLALVPRYGGMGAAIATLVSQPAFLFPLLVVPRDQEPGR